MEVKEFIRLNKEAKQERINLLNLQCKKILSYEDDARLELLDLLFEMEQKQLTKSDFKKKINQLYSANKNKNNHYNSKGHYELSNRTVDTIANSSILQSNYKTIKEFFNLAYGFIAGKVYSESVVKENWIYKLN